MAFNEFNGSRLVTVWCHGAPRLRGLKTSDDRWPGPGGISSFHAGPVRDFFTAQMLLSCSISSRAIYRVTLSSGRSDSARRSSWTVASLRETQCAAMIIFNNGEFSFSLLDGGRKRTALLFVRFRLSVRRRPVRSFAEMAESSVKVALHLSNNPYYIDFV